jgi:RimJ/RimL family protein N-acetyltransferase
MESSMFRFDSLSEPYIEWARLLHNDPIVIANLTDPHLVSSAEQKVWFSQLQKSKTQKRIVVFFEEQPVGLIRLDSIDYYNKSLAIGLDISKDFRGQGFAKPIYLQCFKEWFVENNFHRMWLMVADYNARAKHIYESLGFKNEGIQREALFKDGQFYNYLIMSILQKEYIAQYVTSI